MPFRTVPRPFWRKAYPLEAKLRQGFQEERDRIVEQGSWVACEVQDGAELLRRGCCISPSFGVPRKDSHRPRIIADWRLINTMCWKRSSKMEGLKLIPRLAQRGWYAASLDIPDQFMHVGLAREHWKYAVLDLGNPLTGETSVTNPRFVYVTVLPMGYTNSPYVMAKVMSGIVRKCREEGIVLTTYADDWLVLNSTEEGCRADRARVVEILAEHGFDVHVEKGQVEPVQEIYHLGMDVDLKQGLFKVPLAKGEKIQREAKGMLCYAKTNRRWVKAKWLAQFAGRCISVQLAVPTARFRTRSLFDVLAKHGIYQHRQYHHKVKLSRQALQDIAWWRDLEKNATGRAVWKSPTSLVMWADASREPQARIPEERGGWGGEISGLKGVRSSEAQRTVAAHGIWTRQELFQSINFLELRAVKNMILKFAPRLKGHVILLWEDNQAVMYILNSLTSKSAVMMHELRELYDLLAKWDICLRARYIPSALNPADYWSRILRDKADWQWRPAVAYRNMHRWGRRTIDLFASRGTALLSRYCSSVPDPGAEHSDAFSMSWEGEQGWINPPWNRLLEIMAKLEEEPLAEATLLVPWWPGQPWWPLLMKLQDEHVQLPLEPKDIVPGPGCLVKNVVPEPLRNMHWGLGLFHVPVRA